MSAPRFSITEDHWIPMADGTRLASMIWLPEGADSTPAPAVLEFHPYRKRCGVDARDACNYGAFADAGIAGVRVDIRGSGESEGVIDGEYTEQELSDACEIIAWIAAQPWCNGNVGMMGISWGGFNALQVAALQPPALKAIISIASTVDRYNDDIHYKNGCHLSANFSWATTMLAYESRSPDPAEVGERWKDMWLERLAEQTYFLEDWIEHPHRDAFWKHGSICEDFSKVEIPSLVIAGWADGYRNTPLKAVEGLGSNAKALIGPWVHKYPHFASPGPRADFLNLATQWWKQWLGGEPHQVEAWPQVSAFIQAGPRPERYRAQDPGFWIGKAQWQEPDTQVFKVNADGALVADTALSADSPSDARTVFIKTPLTSGTASGEWFCSKPDAEMAGNQRHDDADAFCLDTAPLSESISLLGMPEVSVQLACAAETETLIIRLCDVHPDGTSTRITYGVLNLAFRDSHEHPQAMPKDQMVDVKLKLDACGYQLPAGHQLRLAIGTTSFPLVWPSPEACGLTLDLNTLSLSLPLLGEHERIDMPEPADSSPLPDYPMHSPSETRRQVSHDLNSGSVSYHLVEDTGLEEPAGHGQSYQERREETWVIHPDDPTSMRGTAYWKTRNIRKDDMWNWDASTEITASISCGRDVWVISALVEAFEDGQKVASKRFEKRQNRQFQ